MIAVDRDLAHEAHDSRPIIQGWLLRCALILSVALVAVASLSLVAAWRQLNQSVEVFAVTQRGDVFELPFFDTLEEGRLAAVRMEADRRSERAAQAGAKPMPQPASSLPANEQVVNSSVMTPGGTTR